MTELESESLASAMDAISDLVMTWRELAKGFPVEWVRQRKKFGVAG